MGFFNKIFGGTKDSEATGKIRAQFKDANYFKKEIERFNLFMEDDKEDFQIYIEKNGKLENHHFISACNIRLKKIECIYSKGGSIDELVPILDEVMGYFLKIDARSFKDNALTIKCISLGILLNEIQKHKEGFVSFIEQWESAPVEDMFKPAALVYFLLDQPVNEQVADRGYLPFKLLYDCTQLPKTDIAGAIANYLDDWYALHKEDPWYNTHLRDSGYSGYWAWEVGAVVKKMQLDDSSFRDHTYYPYDMVHWEG